MKQEMQEADTATRIILAAEALFAEKGFAETTMRQITAGAEVNLAAVNYHYGSKNGLITAVARRFIDPICDQVDQGLAERRAVDDVVIRVEELIELLMRALLVVRERNPHTLTLLMRLLDLAYMPGQESLRDFLVAEYGKRIDPIVTLLRLDAAPMDDAEFFWRLHFLLGSLVFTLSNYETLSRFDGAMESEAQEIERILCRMVPVLSAGFQARAERTHFCKV